MKQWTEDRVFDCEVGHIEATIHFTEFAEDDIDVTQVEYTADGVCFLDLAYEVAAAAYGAIIACA